MATILNFVPKPRRPSTALPKAMPRDASVIIFPGVRYEKFAATPTDGGGGDDRPRDARRGVTKQ